MTNLQHVQLCLHVATLPVAVCMGLVQLLTEYQQQRRRQRDMGGRGSSRRLVRRLAEWTLSSAHDLDLKSTPVANGAARCVLNVAQRSARHQRYSPATSAPSPRRCQRVKAAVTQPRRRVAGRLPHSFGFRSVSECLFLGPIGRVMIADILPQRSAMLKHMLIPPA